MLKQKKIPKQQSSISLTFITSPISHTGSSLSNHHYHRPHLHSSHRHRTCLKTTTDLLLQNDSSHHQVSHHRHGHGPHRYSRSPVRYRRRLPLWLHLRPQRLFWLAQHRQCLCPASVLHEHTRSPVPTERTQMRSQHLLQRWRLLRRRLLRRQRQPGRD